MRVRVASAREVTAAGSTPHGTPAALRGANATPLADGDAATKGVKGPDTGWMPFHACSVLFQSAKPSQVSDPLR